MLTPQEDPNASALATWFDGHSAKRHAVRVRLQGDTVELSTEPGAAPSHGNSTVARQFALKTLVAGEHWPGLPLPVGLPDGGTLWLDDAAGALGSALRDAWAHRPFVRRLIDSWLAVVVCVLSLLALLVWFDRHGAGMAAQAALRVLPPSVDHTIGEKAMEALGKQWLARSTVPLNRQRLLAERFAALTLRMEPDSKARVEFRSLRGEPGFNAFSLPGGTIVVLDGMSAALTDDELMFVLGHELGHVVHRHGMQAVMRSFGLVAVAGVAMGDFSTVAVGVATTLQNLRHSRDAELEADAFARGFARLAGLGADVEAAVWRKIARKEREAGTSGLPRWLSTHPPTEERLRSSGARGTGR